MVYKVEHVFLDRIYPSQRYFITCPNEIFMSHKDNQFIILQCLADQKLFYDIY